MKPALTDVPVIETARLRLRGPQIGDFPVWADCAASDRARHIGGPMNRGMAWRAFCHLVGHWPLRGYGMFVFCDRDSDAPLGMCGPWFPEEWPEPEIGWTIWVPEAEGRGLAFEAALAARRFAYRTLGWTTAISLIAAANTRSQALARRMGCAPDGLFVHEICGESTICRHPMPESIA
ncbi:MAG: GNAT family N-acetyltransferase [Gemmobacter sp.]